MKNKKISVIMAVYNGEEYLNKAIESILNQSYENFEFLIINDGSTDKSFEIIEKYANLDKRIVVIDHKNIGLTKSLNIGIEKATGEYIARMDADDISMTARFKNFILYIEKNGDIDFYSTPSYVIDENDKLKKVIPNYFIRNGLDVKILNYFNVLIHGTLIVKSDILKKYKYNERFKYSQDFELYQRLIQHNYKISYDNNVTYSLRVHSSSITQTKNKSQLDDYKQVFLDNNLEFYPLSKINKFYFKYITIYLYIKKIIGFTK